MIGLFFLKGLTGTLTQIDLESTSLRSPVNGSRWSGSNCLICQCSLTQFFYLLSQQFPAFPSKSHGTLQLPRSSQKHLCFDFHSKPHMLYVFKQLWTKDSLIKVHCTIIRERK